jgi:hypothetical protein
VHALITYGYDTLAAAVILMFVLWVIDTVLR